MYILINEATDVSFEKNFLIDLYRKRLMMFFYVLVLICDCVASYYINFTTKSMFSKGGFPRRKIKLLFWV